MRMNIFNCQVKYVLILLFITSAFSFVFWYFSNVLENEMTGYVRDVTPQVGDIFQLLDSNKDGNLDLAEFAKLQEDYKLFQYVSSTDTSADENHEVQKFPDIPVKLGEQIISIETSFQPLILSSMKKNVEAVPENELGPLSGLINWTRPFKMNHAFGARSFKLFLPSTNIEKPGIPWWIIEPKLSKYSTPLSSERYFPSIVEKKFHILFALLSLFHPQPFLWGRFGPQGTVAVLRAFTEDFYDIIFRVHAEFQLNKPPLHPFWFTPSQFNGRIIINKDASVVKFFHMEVPNKRLNVDMEWLNGPKQENMEVDIGHIPQMSLLSSAISAANDDKKGADQNISTIEWKREVAVNEALHILELEFYPFKKVKYYNIIEAFQIAMNESKLVHGIILWGNLDDQSC